MALHSLKDFAELCGRKLAHVSQDKSRGKILVDNNNMVNDKEQINASYLKYWQEKTKETNNSGADIHIVDRQPPSSSQKVKEGQKERKSPAEPADTVGALSLFTLEIKNKTLDAEKKTEEIAILKVKKEKIQGILIPTELVKALIIHQSEALKVAYMEAVEGNIALFSQIAQLNADQIARLRKGLVQIVNKAITSSITHSKKTLNNIVKEYSETRGVGERT